MAYAYLEKVYDLAKELNRARDIKAILDTVTDHLPGVIGATYCSLFIRNPSSGELEIKAHNHEDIGNDPFIHVGAEQDSIMNLAITRNHRAGGGQASPEWRTWLDSKEEIGG